MIGFFFNNILKLPDCVYPNNTFKPYRPIQTFLLYKTIFFQIYSFHLIKTAIGPYFLVFIEYNINLNLII